MKRSLLLSAVIAAGVAGLSPSGPGTAFGADRDREEWVKYEDTPRDVRRSIDKERGNYEVKRIDRVTRNGREFWRATIDKKGDDTVIRVDESGKVLSRDEVADTGGRDYRAGGVSRGVGDDNDGRQVKYADLPRNVRNVLDDERGKSEVKSIYEVRDVRTPYYRAVIDDRNGDRIVRISENGRFLSEEEVREVRTASGRLGSSRDRDLDRGEVIAFERLPGDVKTAFGREAGPDRVRDVTRLTRNGRTVYRAQITGGDRARTVTVDDNGRVVKDDDGDRSADRREVAFRDLPGDVKSAIGKEVDTGTLERVTEITRDGRTYYRAQTRNGDTVVVDDRGRTVRDFDRR